MPVAQSSHIASYAYDDTSQVLTVQFLNGAVYQYQGVPLTEYYNMQQSGGSGTYFHSKIRDQYPTAKIIGPEDRRKRRR